ncbi:MAG: pentapeptide repeat-containing protein [Bdellovibrionales bacterium]|nr:pentapeptide repeat-containing protein [Bdellovibrionales bacterium]
MLDRLHSTVRIAFTAAAISWLVSPAALATNFCIVNGGNAAYNRYFESGLGNGLPGPVQRHCREQASFGGCFRPHADGCYYESDACPGGKCYGLNVGVFGPCGDVSTESQTQFEFTASFHNCEASGRDLQRIRMDGVDAWGANFSNANLEGASFRETDVRMMNLENARVRNAAFHNAVACNLNGSNTESQWPTFSGAKITDTTSGLFRCRRDDGSFVTRVRSTCRLVLDHKAVWSESQGDDGSERRAQCVLESSRKSAGGPDARSIGGDDAVNRRLPAAGGTPLPGEDGSGRSD